MKIKVNEVEKLINAYNKKEKYNIDFDIFDANAKRYIKAIRDRRMMCVIDSVSASGMSRTIRFCEMVKNKTTKDHQLLNFWVFFKVMGYSPVKNSDSFRINGCGMDMIFHTNYSIIHTLQSLGYISKAKASELAQMTPHKL